MRPLKTNSVGAASAPASLVPPGRGDGGLRPVGETLPAAVAGILRRGPMSDEKVRFAWRAVVGASLDRATEVSLGGDGILRVRTESEAWRREVTRASALVVGRLQALLGDQSVTRLEVTGPAGEPARHRRGAGVRPRQRSGTGGRDGGD